MMKKFYLLLIAVFLLVICVYLFFCGLAGWEKNPRVVARLTLDRIQAVTDHNNVIASNTGEKTNIIFLHHSVGNHLIENGSVRELLGEQGYDFWDHNYNWIGLRDPQGNFRDYSYNVPGDNTDTIGFRDIFAQKLYDLPVNTLSGLFQHEVIILKSCFPNSNVDSKANLQERKKMYLQIRDVMAAHQDKLFIILTSPPLNPAETDLRTAARARQVSDWLVSEEFLSGLSNVFVFDYYSLLAEDDSDAVDFNMLREEYREGTDSHPIKNADEEIAPFFVEFIIKTIKTFQGSQN
ncbi:MAG: hypothetical protein JXR41_13875 [Bacteroidales bacterium]|nr:hypothetical protein [Bacteroidales bacterium]